VFSTPRLKKTRPLSKFREVAQKAAEAGTEGGFLGFRDVAVSKSEKATLAEIAAAPSRSGPASA